MLEILAPFIATPVLPATALVGFLVLWSLLVLLLGAADFGLHHLGSGLGHGGIEHGGIEHGGIEHGGIEHGGADPSHLPHGSTPHADLPSGDLPVGILSLLSSLGVRGLRWLNIHEMPLILWACVLAVAWWSVSLVLWLSVDQWIVSRPGGILTSLFVLRNLAITIPVFRLCTLPLRGWFTTSHFPSTSLIGQECEISSSEATPTFGQVKFKTDGAPLLLNVRTDGPHLSKGAKVWITHYDSKRRIYLVSPTTSEHQS